MVIANKFLVYLTLFVVVHLACAVAQNLAVFSLTGAADYGSGIWAGTPVDGLLSFGRLNSYLDLAGIFFAMGDTLTGLFGLAVFNYSMFDGHSGAALWVITGLRTVMSVASGAVLLTIAQAIFQSGIFQSAAGVALVIGSVGVGTIINSLT